MFFVKSVHRFSIKRILFWTYNNPPLILSWPDLFEQCKPGTKLWVLLCQVSFKIFSIFTLRHSKMKNRHRRV